jgi:hypothetical protein
MDRRDREHGKVPGNAPRRCGRSRTRSMCPNPVAPALQSGFVIEARGVVELKGKWLCARRCD